MTKKRPSKSTQKEKREAFLQSALQAKRHYEETGISYPAEEVHLALRARILEHAKQENPQELRMAKKAQAEISVATWNAFNDQFGSFADDFKQQL